MSLAPYRSLLRAPGVPWMLVASTLARLPQGFQVLAVVLLVREATGSFALAGGAAGAMALAGGLTTPPLGRVMDRLGQAQVLVPCAVGTALGLAGMVVAADAGAPGWVLVGVAALTGAMTPPASSAVRAIWPEMVPHDRLEIAYSVESVVQELVWIGGPLVAALLAGLASPEAAVVANGVMWVGGTLAYATVPRARARGASAGAHRGVGAIRSAGLRTLVLAAVVIADVFGAVEAAMAAFARAQGTPAAAGLMIAPMAAASMAGGVWHGARTWSAPPEVRMRVFGMFFALGLVPLAAAPNLGVMAVFMAVGGLAVAPLMANLFTLAGTVTPEGSRAEGFGWIASGFVVGGAAGSIAAGATVDAIGLRPTLLGVAALALLVPLVALAGRRGLVSPGPRPPRAASPAPGA